MTWLQHSYLDLELLFDQWGICNSKITKLKKKIADKVCVDKNIPT